MGEGNGEDEWMCGRQQEEKQGRKAELFYLESVLSGRPLDHIYMSDLWGFHLVLERETERGNAEEGEASWAGDGTLSRMSEWHGERPECRSVNTAPSSQGKRKSRPALLHPSPGGREDRWATQASSPNACTSILSSSAGHIQTQQVRG